MMNQTQEVDIIKFIKNTALPAMQELKDELTEKYNMDVEIRSCCNRMSRRWSWWYIKGR